MSVNCDHYVSETEDINSPEFHRRIATKHEVVSLLAMTANFDL